jgi:hypothetical protein
MTGIVLSLHRYGRPKTKSASRTKGRESRKGGTRQGIEFEDLAACIDALEEAATKQVEARAWMPEAASGYSA